MVMVIVMLTQLLGGGPLGYLVPEGNKYRNLIHRLGDSQILDSKNMVMSPAWLGPEKDCADEFQEELWTTDQTSDQRGRPSGTSQLLSEEDWKEIRRKIGRGSQMGAWH
jgi:hypothetical protein